MTGKPGPTNGLCDVSGLKIGHGTDHKVKTGVTVILPNEAAVCAVDVRGGGPGTRETDLLSPETMVEKVTAVVLAGGSVYGLAAADGVAAMLGAKGQGFSLMKMPGVPVSPIVPSAILYDLANGGDKDWGETPPYNALGRAALAAVGESAEIGAIGAGAGAKAGAYAGGLGMASFVTSDGIEVAAVAAVNSFGSPYMPGTKQFWAAPFEIGTEFGGRGIGKASSASGFPPDTKLGAPSGANTTICLVATNVTLSQAEAKRLAIMAQDGLARAIRPAHAPTDGDVVFALSTGIKDLAEPKTLSLTQLGSMAGDCLTRAIARGVYAAEETKE